MKPNQLTPEFAVRDISKSLSFYCDTLGFKIEYQRPEEGFALVSLNSAQLMLDQIDIGRSFGENLQDKPLGLGLNVQIFVDEPHLLHMLGALEEMEYPLFLQLEEKWYRQNDIELGHKQFVVADPDGYFLRFAVKLINREK